MRLTQLLTEEAIEVSLKQTKKKSVIEELLVLAIKGGNINNRMKAFDDIMKREEMMSTGLEHGIAVPHAKTKAADDLTLSLGISKEGIDFDAADGKPSHLFFLLLAPEDAAGPNVKILAEIARLTKDKNFCKSLINASSPKEVLELIDEAE
ncbi:MAG: PTS sugar transporter subunit IIA [bacterium]